MNAVREAWHPETKADRDAVLRELKEVLASQQFCNSKRYPALLRYVVEHTLAGDSDNLKERTLGVEVFGRPATYDTSLDTVVRYTAGEIRKRLSLYYHEDGREARIQIQLPAGSYVPEFTCSDPGAEVEERTTSLPLATPVDHAPLVVEGIQEAAVAPHGAEPATFQEEGRQRRDSRWMLWAAVGAALLLVCGGLMVKLRASRATGAVDAFWEPLAHEPGKALVCLGGVIFQQNGYSGVVTAGREIEYPFVSMQIASSLPLVGQVMDSERKAYDVQSSASTPITQMRNRPLVLLGGYNNDWTMRMLRPLRYQFTQEPVESIGDMQNPNVRWTRDKTIPYSSADDYALVARFRDQSTDGFVVVLAGLGRNGSEAAAQFATSDRYMGMVRDRIGNDLKGKNLEIVLKVNVFDGKTGAPSIVAVHTW